MISLKALAQSAMLGTRNGFTAPVLDQIPVPETDLEAALLVSAAVVGTAELGGVLPMQGENRLNPSLPESRPQISGRAARLLERVLTGEFEVVLTEFLQQISTRELIVPPEMLPALLGIANNDLRLLVIQVIGERGQWLARQNPAWANTLDRDPRDAWENGVHTERVAALEGLRVSDPDTARAWIQSTWEQDAPEDRAAFVRALAIGLSMDDEPFLEACLDDRRKEVRDAARGLLLLLEQSRYSLRMRQRLDGLIKLKSKRFGGDRLEVNLPEDLNASARRDGIGSTQIRKTMGDKAKQLAQMIACIPPSHWSREFGRIPEKLIEAAWSSEWKEPLISGWQLAACNCRDSVWVEALASFWVYQDTELKILVPDYLNDMVLLMRPEKVEALAQALIKPKIKELGDRSPLLVLLEKYRQPWTTTLARAVVHSAQRQSGGPSIRLNLALPGFAQWVPAGLASEFSQGWAEEPQGLWVNRIDQFLSMLNFRTEIQQSLME